ncbi:hypothetical protein K491DRAFT_745837 [Lophiostoma macrostomum CBS 122681]|uniref:Uncharacterized protein n=1 Tax=Lophiostoma macrostomum CBS 122681 TaxID=1314788 RepID=A0A6A6T831_9PLEO|nr:hypothetical protein K491DRAFT_745837 [Lophiostoma macrostomum CBS 122681]
MSLADNLAAFRAAIAQRPVPVGTTCPRIFFSADGENLLLATSRLAIWQFIDTLPDESRVKAFAQGREDRATGESWIRVRKGWHQAGRLHITVEMLWIRDVPGQLRYVENSVAHIFKGGREDWFDTFHQRWVRNAGSKIYQKRTTPIRFPARGLIPPGPMFRPSTSSPPPTVARPRDLSPLGPKPSPTTQRRLVPPPALAPASWLPGALASRLMSVGSTWLPPHVSGLPLLPPHLARLPLAPASCVGPALPPSSVVPGQVHLLPPHGSSLPLAPASRLPPPLVPASGVLGALASRLMSAARTCSRLMCLAPCSRLTMSASSLSLSRHPARGLIPPEPKLPPRCRHPEFGGTSSQRTTLPRSTAIRILRGYAGTVRPLQEGCRCLWIARGMIEAENGVRYELVMKPASCHLLAVLLVDS